MAPGPIASPMICPVLVGRNAQLAGLRRLVAAASGGNGQVALIAGEAGLGKSRLAGETAAYARTQGFTVLEGRCSPPDSSIPYALLLDLLRSQLLQHQAPAQGDPPNPQLRELVQLLPGLVPLRPEPPLLAWAAPETQKSRLLTTLTRYFIQLAQQQPLLLRFEDLHWSDSSSLEYLYHLARQIRSHRLILLLTYRDNEQSPALTQLLAQLNRERMAHEILLTPLAPGEIDQMVRAILGLKRPVRAEFLEIISSLAEGNPFFAEEILKSLSPPGLGPESNALDHAPLSKQHIPRSVQDAVRQRVDRLEPTARRVIELAAVAGRRFDFTLLQELAHLDEDALLRAMKQLLAEQLVLEESADRFAFRHGLTRQAIFSGLLARERQVLHGTIAQALARVHAKEPDRYLSDLAYHSYEAAAWEEALPYAKRAAERAIALHDPRVAIEQLTRALSAAEQLQLPPDPELMLKRGQACAILGDFERAYADQQAALEQAQARQDRQNEWQALLSIGFLLLQRDYFQAGTYFRRALALARSLNAPNPLAHTLNRLGNWHLNREEPTTALEHHHEALAIFEAAGNRHGIAETLDLLGMTYYFRGDLAQASAHYDRAIALFDEQGRRMEAAAAASMRAGLDTVLYPADTLVIPGCLRTDAFDQALAEILAFEREIGWRSGEAFTLTVATLALGPRGEYGQALATAEGCLAITHNIAHHQWIANASCGLGLVYLDLLAFDKAEQHLKQTLTLAQEIGSLYWSRLAGSKLASVAIQQGALDSAEAILASALVPASPAQTIAERQCRYTQAELELARGNAPGALEIVTELIGSAPNRSSDTVIPRLWRLKGQALAALGRGQEAESTLLSGRQVAQAQGTRSLLWQIEADLAKLYAAEGRHADAEQACLAGDNLVQELAATVSDSELRTQFVRRATATFPRHGRRAARRTHRRTFHGLTRREREVAALVAQGKTNREIAELLVLSQRTVEDHVSNILGKLGASSRAQIAAWAVEKGLSAGDS